MQISINLLPSEYRKKEMTPMALLLPSLACMTLVVALAAFWGWTKFGQLTQATSRHTQFAETWSERKPRLDYQASLAGEEREFGDRSETIKAIAASRVPWTRKLDELTNVVVDDADGERGLVWLTSLNIKEGTAGGARSKNAVGDLLDLDGYCFAETNELKHFNNFHEAVKNSKFFKSDFQRINNPAGQSITMGDKLVPSRAWTVKLALQMNPPQPPSKAKPGTGLRASANQGTNK
jgi:Tfp pilus assembly protein PilN